MSLNTGGQGTNGPWSQAAGNDVTVAFPFAHKIYDEDHLVVLLTVDATNVTTVQTKTTHYTVSGVAADAHATTTPTVTMVTAPATGETLTQYRKGTLTQLITLNEGTFWQSISLEQKLDLLVMDVQYLQLQLSRCAQGSLAAAAVTTTLEELLAAAGLPMSSLVAKAVLVAGDLLMIGDSADSYAAKKATLTNLITFILSQFIDTSAGAGDAGKGIKLNGSGLIDATMITPGSDSTAIHDNVAAEISALSAIVLADGDSLIAEDLDAGTPNSKKKLLASALYTYILSKLDADKYAGALKRNAIITLIGADGNALAAGLTQARWVAPCAGTITQNTVLLDQSGSIVIDIWKDTYANFPPTDADSITASAPPTVTTATKSQDSTLTGWTKTFSAGDIFYFNIDSADTATSATLIIDYNVTGA